MFPGCLRAWSPVARTACTHVLDALSQLICCMHVPVAIPTRAPYGAPTTTVLCPALTVLSVAADSSCIAPFISRMASVRPYPAERG